MVSKDVLHELAEKVRQDAQEAGQLAELARWMVISALVDDSNAPDPETILAGAERLLKRIGNLAQRIEHRAERAALQHAYTKEEVREQYYS